MNQINRLPKMIITDLDGTLLRTDDGVSDYTLDVLFRYRRRGVLTAIATARYDIECKKFVELLNPDVVITTDGALTRYQGKVVDKFEIDVPTTNRLVHYLLQYDAKDVVVGVETGCFWNGVHRSHSKILHEADYHDYSVPIKEESYKISATIPHEDVLQKLESHFPELKTISYMGEDVYGFVNPKTSKMNAIQSVLDFLGMDKTDVMVFGDDYNDMEMIRQCGTGVAMSNAWDEVKEVADYVTLSNDKDGVAYFLDKLLNGYYNS